MRRWILVLSVLTACYGTKLDDRIVSLQKRLEQAEKEQTKASREIVRLTAKLDRAKLQSIRKQIDVYEQKQERPETLFMEEREILYRLIQSGQMPQAMEAQVELDRILRMITERSNGEE